MKLLFVSERKDLFESIKNLLPNINISMCKTISQNEDLKEYNLIALTDYTDGITKDIIDRNKVINIHQSLLPSFSQKDALKDAYLAGVKVTGVTVHKVDSIDNEVLNGKIIAQYPVLIDNFTHYDELEKEIIQIENQLYPLVIKSIMEDKVFDIVDFLAIPQNNKQCRGNCNGTCSKCKK